MMYRVNEIFYSLQGEGFWTGTPMVFVRFSGCNLRCPFCDTDHSGATMLSAAEIVAASEAALAGGRDLPPRVCLTGGEPSLQVDTELVTAFHEAGFLLHIETNGTRPLVDGIDWVTLSPKEDVEGLVGGGKVVLERADELKLVYSHGVDPSRWLSFPATWHFLQPCALPDGSVNTSETVSYILSHPSWRLSLQTHKLLDIR